MSWKKYLITAVVIFFVLFCAYLTRKEKQQEQKFQPATQTTNIRQPGQTLSVADDSVSPNSPEAITHGEIIREAQNDNPSQQRFLVKSPIDGSIRELFEINESDVTFEKLTPQNWSPSNRFVFVYVDYPDRRDVVFMKTDGKFTNGQYWLHSTGLYPTMNVVSAKWVDDATLTLQTTDTKTHANQNYTVNFDDDTGIVMPAR